jgi:fructokinase
MDKNKPIHVFGEVLFDHFPDGNRALGGAPFNVAWHLQAFGHSPHFISRIGNDPEGIEVTSLMNQWGMNKASLQIDSEHSTGSVQVSIDDDEPQYDIIPDCAYDFISGTLIDTKATEGILYHGSLAIRNPSSLEALETIKALHKGKTFIDVNLRPPWWGKAALDKLLHDADWVKLNEAELVALCPNRDGLENTMKAFCLEYGLEMLIVTRGAKGAITCDRQQRFVSTQPPAATRVVDTVGAGDAFAALLLMGINRQWSLETSLERAQAFACAIVGRRGATVTDHAFYRSFIDKWG